ncbi:MAG: hypothetical protein JRG91_05175 [Deltaproteobacteria bacterium]|nr:hypothetical protein [Deltaproteobacteria bacterium]
MRAASAIALLALTCACSGRQIEGTPDAGVEPDASVDPIVDEARDDGSVVDDPADDPRVEAEDVIDEHVEDPAGEDGGPACDAPGPRTGCIETGGTEIFPMCCPEVADYPVTCGSDPCGCPEIESHNVAACDCGEGRCFDGLCCVSI